MENEEPTGSEDQEILVVGIGASAGGLKALESFFHQVEPNLGAAYVVIQHLSPDFKSLMGELLARHTDLPISPVENDGPIQPNRIYLIPPRKILFLEGNRFQLRDAERSPSLPVDVFFASLAERFGKNAVGVVLSGTGSDGMLGAKSIKKAGGYILVQDPDSAEFDGMPRSVIQCGAYDQILKPENMANGLARARLYSQTKPPPLFEQPIYSIGDSLRRTYGLDIASYKESTVNRRIQRRIEMVGENSIESYSHRIAHDNLELDLLYRDLLIGVSSFFRDAHVWSYLAETTLPQLFQTANKAELRAWVAGCATGEEVYTLCMLLLEEAERTNYQGSIHIFATDLHQGSLARASEGVYSEESAETIPPDLLAKYFTKEGSNYRVLPTLRSKIVFASHNLIVDPPFTRLDIATCRNLLIYLEPAAQDKAISMLLFGLRTEGNLVLGASENPSSDGFGTIIKDANCKVFEKVRQIPIADLPSTPSAHAARPFRQHWLRKKGVTVDAQLLADYDAILAKQVGDGFIIGEQQQVLQYIGDPNPYLKPLSGRVTPSILSQLAGDLNLALSTCLQRVNTSGSSFTMHGVRYSSDQDKPLVDLRVDALPGSGESKHYFVSIKRKEIEPLSIQPPTTTTPAEPSEDYHSIGAPIRRIAELELELQANRENLQAAIEQSQMSNEELQASNEELLASNEELQSTNEELHSVNEELFSVNSEFEQKNIELHALNQDYDRLLSSLVNIGILYLDDNLRVKKFNQAVTSIFKLMKEDEGRPIEHIAYALGNHQKFLRRVNKVIEEKTAISFETKTPKDEFLMVRIFPYENREDGGGGAIITFTDISDIKIAQSRLETAVSVSKMVWWDWDVELDVFHTYCSDKRGFDCILGYNQHNIPVNYEGWIAITHPDDISRVKESLQKHLDGQTPHWVSEHRYRSPEGEWLWVRDSGEVVLRDANGQALKMVGTTQNIDKRKRLELQLLDSNREKENMLARAASDSIELKKLAKDAEKASRTKSQFLAMMSHEIRTPLNAIIGYSDLLLNLDLDSDIRENLKAIAVAGGNLSSIIGDILDFSKLESDTLQLDESVFSIQDLLNRADSSIPFKAGVERSYQLVDLSLQPYDKPLWLIGDPTRLCQILVNLIGNAVKFTESGKVTFTTQIRSTRNGKTNLSFVVRDQGIGIKEENIPTIFLPFSQSDSSINRSYGGTGLGLSISKRLVESMGSEIHVESQLGQGSTFSFELTLPIYQPNETPPIPEKTSEAKRQLHALIVEDNPENRVLLAKMLESLGVSSDQAENGRQGIEMLYSTEYDIVFMDLSMDKLNGIEATRAIRSLNDERFRDVPIVAITANVDVETRKLCEEVGMNDFIAKPTNLSKIKNVLATRFDLLETV